MITPQFINECLAGNESSIQSLVRAHQRGVFQIALTVLDDGSMAANEAAAQAEFATGDTFITAIDQIGRYREDIPFTIWLYRIAIRNSRRRFHRLRLKRALRAVWRLLPGNKYKPARVDFFAEKPASGGNGGSSPGENPLESAGLMFDTVRDLDEKLRLPVVLRYYHDFSAAEIAQLLHLGEGAVHARLDTAREKIAGALAQKEETGND